MLREWRKISLPCNGHVVVVVVVWIFVEVVIKEAVGWGILKDETMDKISWLIKTYLDAVLLVSTEFKEFFITLMLTVVIRWFPLLLQVWLGHYKQSWRPAWWWWCWGRNWRKTSCKIIGGLRVFQHFPQLETVCWLRDITNIVSLPGNQTHMCSLAPWLWFLQDFSCNVQYNTLYVLCTVARDVQSNKNHKWTISQSLELWFVFVDHVLNMFTWSGAVVGVVLHTVTGRFDCSGAGWWYSRSGSWQQESVSVVWTPHVPSQMVLCIHWNMFCDNQLDQKHYSQRRYDPKKLKIHINHIKIWDIFGIFTPVKICKTS